MSHVMQRETCWSSLKALSRMLGIVALLLLAASSALAAEVRETPLSPADEQATFQLADPQLRIELVAAEPQLNSPVAISWDADGRLYVAEMIDYPAGPTAGQIRLLEDRDGDGRYETASVFAKGLNFPNGVLAARDGVFVTAAPDLLFFKDTDGDGQADVRQVVFTGFGEGNQQLRANGLTWGWDNWIYGANGRSNGAVRRPEDPASAAVPIPTRDFRFRPDGSRFEATSGQSQFGQSADDWGNRFLAWNTIPLRHAVFPQDFLDRNPRLSGLGVRDIADPADTGRVYPISPRPQTFNRERTDFYNALCGLTLYRGDRLGPDYVGNAFVGESLTSLVHRRVVTPQGASFVSRRAEPDREFLASTDSWFHPVYLTTGPDGSLYVVDFYRRWVEHPAFVAEKLRGGIDWQHGTGHGRIWRISRRAAADPPPAAPRLSQLPLASLVQTLQSTNGWQRDTAQRLLVERQDPQASPPLRSLAHDGRLPQARARALAALDGIQQLDDATLARALQDPDMHVRTVAIRLARPRLADSAPLRAALAACGISPSAAVRLQAALAWSAVETGEKADALSQLVQGDAEDPLVAAAVIGSAGKSLPSFLAELLTRQPAWRSAPNRAQLQFLTDAAATLCANGADPELSACLNLLGNSAQAASTQPGKTPSLPLGPGDLALLLGAAEGLSDRGVSLHAQLATDSNSLQAHRPAISSAVELARRLAVSDDQNADEGSLDRRITAVQVLGQIDPASGSLLVALLDAKHDQRVQTAAASSLTHADAISAEAALAQWPTLTIPTRRALLQTSLRSPALATALAAGLENDLILPRELEPALREGLLATRDTALRARLEASFKAAAAATDRQQVVARFVPVLERRGDRARGAALFAKQCLLCHLMQGQGNRVGPDLSGIGARPRETLLVDLLDPSRQVTPEFVAYTLLTRQGQVLTGVIAAETNSAVTLRRAEGAQEVVLRSQVEELRSTGKSLMPEGFEQTFDEQQVADLLEFLAQPDAGLFVSPQ